MSQTESVKHIKINVPAQHNPLIQQAQDNINNSEEIRTLWEVINVNAIVRLRMTDHGPVHFQIVSNIALRVARILKKHEINLSIEDDFGLSNEHGELVIFLASLFHDMGMSVNREGHEELSLFITNNLLHQILEFLPIKERTIVISETLHAILSHRKGGTPYTVEAGILRVADALDMSEGRSRIPYEAGNIDIHSLSASAIDEIQIVEGIVKPVQINITMNNSAGLFQVDELLKKKMYGSGIEKYVSIKAYIDSEHEKNLLKEFIID